MAIRLSSPPLISIHHNPNPTPSTSNRVLMLANTGSHKPSVIKLQKVFEDKSSGVVCYRDDKGEITCEGYDEGPRLHHQGFSRFSWFQRDGEAIVDLLKRSLLLVADGAGKVK